MIDRVQVIDIEIIIESETNQLPTAAAWVNLTTERKIAILDSVLDHI